MHGTAASGSQRKQSCAGALIEEDAADRFRRFDEERCDLQRALNARILRAAAALAAAGFFIVAISMFLLKLGTVGFGVGTGTGAFVMMSGLLCSTLVDSDIDDYFAHHPTVHAVFMGLLFVCIVSFGLTYVPLYWISMLPFCMQYYWVLAFLQPFVRSSAR